MILLVNTSEASYGTFDKKKKFLQQQKNFLNFHLNVFNIV